MQLQLHPSLRLPGVYLISAPGALYVGQSDDIRSRFLHHLHLARTGKHPRAGLNGAELSCEILQVESNKRKRLRLEMLWQLLFEGAANVEALGNKIGRLTPQQVRMIRDLKPKYGDNTLQRAADQLGVSVAVLYAIRKGRRYKHVSSSDTSSADNAR